MIDKFFMATKGYITHKGKVLIIREASTNPDGTNEGKYDFPGGRLEPGEHPEEALRREIKEETGLEVMMGNPFSLSEWRPVVRGEKWQIVAVYIRCESLTDEITLSNEHDDYQWVDPDTLLDYPLMKNIKELFQEKKM